MADNTENQCLNLLDEWIKSQKEEIYDRNFKGPTNDSSVLHEYRNELFNLCLKIKRAIWSADTSILVQLGWSQDLIDCAGNPNMRLEICDRLCEWLITFPSVKNAEHLDKVLSEL